MNTGNARFVETIFALAGHVTTPKEAKLLLFTKLFELGRVSSGKAAEACGMTRVELMLAAGKLGFSPVQLDAEELTRELADA